jgi:hypothetical protein
MSQVKSHARSQCRGQVKPQVGSRSSVALPPVNIGTLTFNGQALTYNASILTYNP